MARTKRRSIPDDLWEKIETLIPPSPGRASGGSYERRPGGGRKPMSARQAFEAIIHVLRTKTQWKALPRRFGSASAVHSRFKHWEEKGFFDAIWQAGLAEHDGMRGIAWEWDDPEAAGESPEKGESPLPMEAGGKDAPPGTSDVRARSWRPAGIQRRTRKGPEHKV